MVHPLPTQPHIAGNSVGSPTDAAEPTEAQRLFGVHEANLQSLRDRYGADLEVMDVGELLALQSLVTDRLAAIPEQHLADSTRDDETSLSPADLSRIAEENHRRFYNFQCRLALLLEGWFETVEARGATLAHKGKQPFKNSKDFIARLLGIDIKEVERRLRIATANPTRRIKNAGGQNRKSDGPRQN